jgi:hypothetical protein
MKYESVYESKLNYVSWMPGFQIEYSGRKENP